MNTRHTLLLGLAGLGFVLAMPAHAEPDSRGDGQRQERRAERHDHRAERHELRGRESDGYGYGYERRQQQADPARSPRDDEDRRRNR
jgi:hypothetical protein